MIVCLIVSGLALALDNSIFKPTNKSIMVSSTTKAERNSASAITNIVDNISKMAGVLVLSNMLLILGDTSSGTMDACPQFILFVIVGLAIAGLVIAVKHIRLGYIKNTPQ